MKVGDFARYQNTGTVGKVLDVKEEEGVTWVHLDTYDLYYDALTLESASADEYHDVTKRDKDISSKLEDLEGLTESLSKVDISRITPSGT